MKQVSAELAAAIESSERIVFHDLQVDWDNDGYDGSLSMDDVSQKVSLLRKTHALSSDLPPQTRMTPGVAVAELSMQLGSGNLVQNTIPVAYRSAAQTSSGGSVYAYAARPTGSQVGDVILLALFTSPLSTSAGINGYTNVDWSVLALRADGAAAKITGYLLTRRVAINEPEVYTFDLGDSVVWTAATVCVGSPYIMGIHQYTSKGRDDTTPASNTVTGVPITTTLPTTLISIFAADTGPIVSGSWTAATEDTERLDFTTASVGSTHNISTAVMSRDNVAPGTYTSNATFSHTVNATLVFTIALAGRPSGDERQHAAWTFSELNPISPYAGKIRSGRNTKWRVGFAGVNGVEYVNMFMGRTLDGGGSSRNRLAMITALDNRETLRNRALLTLDRLIAESPVLNYTTTEPTWPGLEATFIVSFLLANAFTFDLSFIVTPQTTLKGYFASYEPHKSTILWVPCHGSLHPHDYGRVILAYTQDVSGSNRRITYARGPFVAATDTAPMTPGFTKARWHYHGVDHSFVEATSQTIGRIQFSGKRMTTTSSVTIGTEPNATTYARLQITTGGVLQLLLGTEAGVTRTVVGPVVPIGTDWHFYGVHWDSATGSAQFRVDGTATTVAFATWTNSVLTNTEHEGTLFSTNGMQIAEIQIMTGVPAYGVATSYVITLSDPWSYDTFVPSAFIDKSLLVLDALPFMESSIDIWETITEIAQAEFAANYFDDNGYPHYRTAYTDSTPVGQTVQKQLTARSHLKDLAYTSSIRQVANTVSVAYTPLTINIEAEVWRSSGAIRIGAGSTYETTIRAPGIFIETSGISIIETNTEPDGSGDVVTSNISSYGFMGALPYDLTIGIINTNLFDIYLVDTTGGPGVFAFATWISPINDAAPREATDSDSVRKYMTQPMDVSNSVWRQRSDVAISQAVQLVTTLARPRPILDSVPIVGDPRLEFGDLTTVVDLNGLGVSANYRIAGINSVSDVGQGFTQDVTLREAPSTLTWNVNLWDDGFIWGP